MKKRSNRAFVDYGPDDSEAHGLGSKSFRTSLRSSQNIRQTGLIDVLDAGFQYDIPIYFFPASNKTSWALRTVPTWAPTFPLGGGMTCTAERYEIQTDIGPDLPSGTAVAAKRYRVKNQDETSPNEGENKAIFQMIKQEVEMMSSLALRNEKNIAKLHFIGFAEASRFPIVGMELALHGTLDYVLRCPGDSLTDADKINFTIDMALGLDALHRANIVHGDLKCENILICHHAARGIVAKDYGLLWKLSCRPGSLRRCKTVPLHLAVVPARGAPPRCRYRLEEGRCLRIRPLGC